MTAQSMTKKLSLVVASLVIFSGMAESLLARSIKSLAVYPAKVSLTTSKDRQSYVVQAVYDDGITMDVTSSAKATINGNAAKQDKNVLYPQADGKAELKVEFEGQTVSVPVEVTRAAEKPPVSFKLDVMPIFMKAGCNSGSCHGAARGKDGFMLSLFGYDPDGDHHRITREQYGRRINLAVPEASMLVEKSIGAVPHTGGKLFEKDSELCKSMTSWIAAGVPKDPTDIATCTDLELFPKQAVLNGEGSTQKLTVLAHYSDGTTRDVTSLALFLSSNDNSAPVSNDGTVTASKRGEAFVMARFATHTVGSQFLVLPKDLQYTPTSEQPANYIDELVLEKLKKIRVNPSELCTDEEFVRRVYVDLVGLVPTEEEFNKFVNDKAADKRAKLIDELIDRKEFTELWVSKWAEWLMMRSSNQVDYKSIILYYTWLADKIGNNVPLDKMVQELLASEGGTFKVPQTNFYELERDNLKVAENVAQIFMGMRIQCAQCHNHPFDRWTQDDYYSFAAFFSQIGRKNAEDYRERIIYNRKSGEVRHVVTGKNAPPVFLGGGPAETAGKDRRAVLAKWLASPENPFFAKNFSNRIWHHFFGRGIIDPIDDVRVSNPPSNPELLEELAKRFTDYKYDFKAIVRDICNSKTYQRSTKRNATNETDETNFAHQNIRRIKAESMLDIISLVTNTQDKFQGLPKGARAVQIADGRTTNYFLTTFGRATRETVCSCEVKMEPTLSQALHLLNGDTVNRKITEGGLVKQFKAEKLTPEQTIEKLYIRSLGRKPKKEELDSLLPLYADETQYEKATEDVFWALLNSREFLFNH